MNLSPNIKLPPRQTVADAALIVLFCALAIVGLGSLLFGFWLFWHPGAFLAGGAIALAIGCLGALGRSAPKEEEPF